MVLSDYKRDIDRKSNSQSSDQEVLLTCGYSALHNESLIQLIYQNDIGA